MKQSEFPKDWNEERVRAVIKHYDRQTEDEAVAEYEAALARRKAVGAEKQEPRSERPAEYDHDHPASLIAEKVEEYDKGDE